MPVSVRLKKGAGLPEQASAFRCGREFTAEPVVLADLTSGELARLRADPLLLVEEVEMPEEPEESDVTDAELDALVLEKVRTLGPADMTGSGKPKVEVLQALLPEHEARIDAALRDRVWATHQASQTQTQAATGGEGS